MQQRWLQDILGALPINFAPINENTAGDRTIIAAVPNYRIRVYHYCWRTSSNNLQWKSGDGTALSGVFGEPGSGTRSEFCSWGLLQTKGGQALLLNLAAGFQVSGHLSYLLIPA